jgi:hypothetical protein
VAWSRPTNLAEWEQAYAAVIEDYEDELAALETERAKVESDAQTLGQVVSGYQTAQTEWKVIEQRMSRQNTDLAESLEDRERRLALAEEFLTREGYGKLTNGKWTRMR